MRFLIYAMFNISLIYSKEYEGNGPKPYDVIGILTVRIPGMPAMYKKRHCREIQQHINHPRVPDGLCMPGCPGLSDFISVLWFPCVFARERASIDRRYRCSIRKGAVGYICGH